MPVDEYGTGYTVGSETSKEGAEKVNPTKEAIKIKILKYIMDRGSSTQDEFAVNNEFDKNTSSPRFAELEKAGLIEKRQDPETGKWMTRKSSKGVNVWVYFATLKTYIEYGIDYHAEWANRLLGGI